MKMTATFFLAAAAVALSWQAQAGDPNTGRVKASVCKGCHGPNGVSIAPQYPNLAGQKELYLRKALRDYKTGARRDPQCASVARTLSDADIDNLAAYFSNLR